jgi:hypothetical protein
VAARRLGSNGTAACRMHKFLAGERVFRTLGMEEIGDPHEDGETS